MEYEVIKDEIRSIDRTELIPTCGLHEFCSLTFSWLLPSAAIVCIVEGIPILKNNQYIATAIEQGVSPQLWNVFATFGFVLFAIHIACIKIETLNGIFSKVTSKVLLASFEVGLLAFGLMLGKLMVALNDPQLSSWQSWFFGSGLLFYFALHY